MKKITVDAKAFAEAMNKVSRVLKKSAIPILEEIAVSVAGEMICVRAERRGDEGHGCPMH